MIDSLSLDGFEIYELLWDIRKGLWIYAWHTCWNQLDSNILVLHNDFKWKAKALCSRRSLFSFGIGMREDKIQVPNKIHHQ